MMRACSLLAGGFFFVASAAFAAPGIGRFEPTDLKMVEAGELEIDTQVGISSVHLASDRLLLPDVELNLGLLRNVELDIDGSFMLEQYSSKSRSYVGEPLWTGVKLGLFDVRSDARRRAFAGGLQLGPLLPTSTDMRGIGYGALALAGLVYGRLQLAFNGGVMYGPRYVSLEEAAPGRVVGGLDVRWVLDARERWAVLGEVGTSVYWKKKLNELSTTIGVEWSPNEHFSVSAIALGNLLEEGDRVSFLIGFTPRMRLWGRRD